MRVVDARFDMSQIPTRTQIAWLQVSNTTVSMVVGTVPETITFDFSRSSGTETKKQLNKEHHQQQSHPPKKHDVQTMSLETPGKVKTVLTVFFFTVLLPEFLKAQTDSSTIQASTAVGDSFGPPPVLEQSPAFRNRSHIILMTDKMCQIARALGHR